MIERPLSRIRYVLLECVNVNWSITNALKVVKIPYVDWKDTWTKHLIVRAYKIVYV